MKLKDFGAAVPQRHFAFFGHCAYAEPAASKTRTMVASANEPDLFNMSMPPVSFHGAAPLTADRLVGKSASPPV
ncbi:MAG: hypothetical protein E6J71_25345 [Deltaproteobacteria bacterium]|nr:MAG: hypothetical protein E6J71_25345 [Deltaproteobacteria bacterium]